MASIFKKNINRSIGGNLAVFLVLVLISVFMALPMYYAVISAFKPINELVIFPPRFYVANPTLSNFKSLSSVTNNFYVPISRYAFNSVLVSVVSTAAHLILASMAAYPLCKHQFPGKGFLNSIVRLALLFAGPVIALPRYIVISKLGLINNQLSIIFITISSTLGLYLMQQFMSGIPDDIIEAARIDGAGEVRIFWRIIMPNVKPAWLTLIIFAFQGIWNEPGTTYLYKEQLKLLPAIISQINGGGLARAGASSAVALLMMLPPVILFVSSQNMIIETMSTSGIK